MVVSSSFFRTYHLATITPPALPGPTQPPEMAPATPLRVSAYDQASSLLLALLVLVGSIAAALTPIWLAMRGVVPAPPVAVTMVDLNPGEGGGHALGEGDEG